MSRSGVQAQVQVSSTSRSRTGMSRSGVQVQSRPEASSKRCSPGCPGPECRCSPGDVKSTLHSSYITRFPFVFAPCCSPPLSLPRSPRMARARGLGTARLPLRGIDIDPWLGTGPRKDGLEAPDWTPFDWPVLTPGVLPRSASDLDDDLTPELAESHSMRGIPENLRGGIARLLVQQCLPWHACLRQFIIHVCVYCRRTSAYLGCFVEGALTELQDLRNTCDGHADVINSVTTRAGELTKNLQHVADRIDKHWQTRPELASSQPTDAEVQTHL